jgi:SiaC family regulatory phosphoprotein
MLSIERTNSTPEIHVDDHSFKMIGVCTPENPPKFFDTFKVEFETLIMSSNAKELVFHLDYFNTGSSKCLLNLFKAVSQRENKQSIKIIWKYENGDDEMLESGELYSEIADIDFELVEVND